eukprot:GAHX01001066.1.p1 GENE.GAHX01001066.1~~GAHX01001066.1.p1  ORF type:complete len:74 (-),score=10.09 GAHX01001066.1:261-482(-)
MNQSIVFGELKDLWLMIEAKTPIMKISIKRGYCVQIRGTTLPNPGKINILCTPRPPSARSGLLCAGMHETAYT